MLTARRYNLKAIYIFNVDVFYTIKKDFIDWHYQVQDSTGMLSACLVCPSVRPSVFTITQEQLDVESHETLHTYISG